MNRRTLIFLALFPLALAAILVLALTTLDLNPYRPQIVWSLEQAFARPVELGTINLTFDDGLVLELHDLSVGQADDSNHFHAGRALFQPRILPLLSGQLSFKRIELERPVVQVTLPDPVETTESEAPPQTSLLTNLGELRQLQLHEASLQLLNLSPEIPRLSLKNLELDIKGFRQGETCRVELSGKVGRDTPKTAVSLSARLAIPQASETWISRQLDIKLAVRKFLRSDWPDLLPQEVSRFLPQYPVDLHVALNNHNGQLSTSLTLEDSSKPAVCKPPNLTFRLQNGSLGGSYATRHNDFDLQLNGKGQLESCGNNLATFSLQQALARQQQDIRHETRIDTKFNAATMFAWLAQEDSGFKASGTLPVRFEISGDSLQTPWHLQADLKELGFFHQDLMLKTPGISGQIEARGDLGANQPLQSGVFELGALKTRISSSSDEQQNSINFQTDAIELTTLAELFPALAQWNLQGQLQSDYRIYKTEDGWQPGGHLELKNVSADHPYPLGPVRNTTAHFEFRDNSATFTCSPLGLGDSELQVQGEITDLGNPVFEVHAETESMLARDLVFKDTEAHLNKLSGNLRIDGRGIDFRQASVALDQGTRADVDGRLDFATNRLHLNARSKYGHIDEVIGLFSGPERWNHKESDPNRPRTGPPFKVTVDAESRKGEIGGVSFENARGTVTVSKGNVEVYPLAFEGQGEGTATARVYYASRTNQPGWLRVSGHLDQFNSSTLYHQYWKQEGDIKGPLDADFFLQGPATKEFFGRGDGAVYLEIRDGSLRRLNAISKAFSILNVSQLLKGELPDVSGHGMKFNTARGTLSFGGGYVYFDDLAIFSNSLNMSMVGRVDVRNSEADYVLGVQPLQTVDKVVSNIPVVGWLLTGDEKTLFTVHFQVKGPLGDPNVIAIPGSSLGSGILGIFQRTLQLPGKLVK